MSLLTESPTKTKILGFKRSLSDVVCKNDDDGLAFGAGGGLIVQMDSSFSTHHQQQQQQQQSTTKKHKVATTPAGSKLIESLSLSPSKSSHLRKRLTTPTPVKSTGWTTEWDWKQSSLTAFSNSPLKFFETKVAGYTTPSKTNKAAAAKKKPLFDGGIDLEQTFIAVGKKLVEQTICPKCRMLYSVGSKEDEQTHKKHCTESGQSPKIIIKNWRSIGKILNSFPNDEGIISIVPGEEDNAVLKSKLESIIKMVNYELGYVEPSKNEVEPDNEEKFFMYMNAEGRVVGFVAAERQSVAHRIKENDDKDDTTIQCEDQFVQVKCGVNRVWTLNSVQRQGIATKLLDSVRRNMFYRCQLDKNQLAVTTPSLSGRVFFSHYFQTQHYPLYRTQQIHHNTDG
ncbi:hypothetical protein SAMD00019534_123870 [Acytostelium subglobosum LB1]|uniref:hypothetical protein n=1 Tax=Acytostelium subglobosum LB1 TaxID=1410327 RepID=UPI000644D01E|nr:hypothetical protein SAMD00019534_123870 [Acytostelium subglobosum LB1]GAM29211.1 hypothetical protein SAMD00019534_123870 [Acytostelium subglobosum LB1]|eukprot:XP_012747902.1 hypothetical protein SAMD00019534_123870 [Acytostelium subglobosum LB1]